MLHLELDSQQSISLLMLISCVNSHLLAIETSLIRVEEHTNL